MGTAGILGSWALQEYIEYLVVRHFRHTWWLGTAGILDAWALQGYSAVGHCRDTWWLGTARILCGWHCKDTLRLGTARILGGLALQGYMAARHCRDALRLGTAGILCGGALHEYSRQRAKTTLTLTSNNSTVRVGSKGCRINLRFFCFWLVFMECLRRELDLAIKIRKIQWRARFCISNV